MATDIAFAVGILTLLGKRIPAALRVLLLALAVIDDLGAIVIIAAFYSTGFTVAGLVVAGLGLASILVLQRFGVRAKVAYIPSGLLVWGGIYGAGVHPTIAGVIVGFMTPVRAWLGPEGFVLGMREELEHLESAGPASLSAHQLAGSLHHVDVARREALSPAESLIDSLHPWVAFGIMPVFALANAGVAFEAGLDDSQALAVAAAVACGLVFGKPLGVLAASGLALRFGLARLPIGVTWRHLIVLGAVAGVGFTMALFIAQLAFGQPHLLAAAKAGVLVASGCAAVLALVLGRLLLTPTPAPGAAETADEAEASTHI